jgi:hypothetical protein
MRKETCTIVSQFTGTSATFSVVGGRILKNIVYHKYKISIVALMMEAARTSETLVNFYRTTTTDYNPEDSHLRTHRRENLKSYLKFLFFCTFLLVGLVL